MKDAIQAILNKPIQYVKGVGEARAKLFHKLNIHTLEDLMSHFPREYEDRSTFKKIEQLIDGDKCAFEGVITSQVSENRIRRGLSIYKIHIKDDTGTIVATWFNQHYIKNVFTVGQKYIFYGKIERKRSIVEIHNPVYEKMDLHEMKNTCRIVPVYPATAQLTQNTIRSTIFNCLNIIEGQLQEYIPQWMRKQYDLWDINHSIKNIHFPNSEVDFKKARYRLVFEELLLLQLGLINMKDTLGEKPLGNQYKSNNEILGFKKNLPFKLTNAQEKVYAEIEKDMEGKFVMNRLVQGDVGSGKTIIAVMALFKAVKGGFQGAFMVPTEILAEQHFRSIQPIMEPYGIKVTLLTGSLTKKDKHSRLEEIEKGICDIVIGTHALIDEKVKFNRLGFVVTDEQHRFGVRQRALLLQKGFNPDVLVMTATPIPRTLALILYGDLDISIIDELPPGRKTIETYAVDDAMRDRINELIKKNIRKGRQAYIVCPLVEESETVEAKSATEHVERIASSDFSEFCVGLIHGKMKSKDKEKVMRDFVEGRVNILVSTTVIEVGVNVPNATIMIIENAERFGLAQLHQLRGRVGRGEYQSYCILYHERKSAISIERMKIMQKTNDGFQISEKDLEIRGPGDFFGTRQHGLPELKIANLYHDIETLKQVQNAVQELMKNDRLLEKEENQLLKQKVDALFRHRGAIV